MLVITVLLVMASFVQNAFAMESYSTSVEIPVRQEVDGRNVPSDIACTYVLEGIGDSPMPDDENNRIVIRGSAEACFGKITYLRPELYYYRITRVPVAARDYKMDKCSYDVIVAALGDGTTRIIAKRSDSEGKSEGIVFRDRYEPGFKMPETGDESWTIYVVICAFALMGVLAVRIGRKRVQGGDAYRK